MATREAPARIGQSREALEEFVEAMHVAQDAVLELQVRCLDQLDGQVFETIGDLITATACAIWDAHPHAGQFTADAVRGGSE
jgi:hypothetical protein